MAYVRRPLQADKVPTGVKGCTKETTVQQDFLVALKLGSIPNFPTLHQNAPLKTMIPIFRGGGSMPKGVAAFVTLARPLYILQTLDTASIGILFIIISMVNHGDLQHRRKPNSKTTSPRVSRFMVEKVLLVTIWRWHCGKARMGGTDSLNIACVSWSNRRLL